MTTSDAHLPAREALLRAAHDELVEKGHANVGLRAVARRAGVSHAAPAHFFGDRAGMLTAVAAQGFGLLAGALEAAAAESADGGEARLAALGRAYVDFGLAYPALIDLMFRRSELTPGDTELLAAQRGALAPLREAVADRAGEHADQWALVSWAVAHGLVTLVREGALAQVVGEDTDVTVLARELLAVFSTGVLPAPEDSR